MACTPQIVIIAVQKDDEDRIQFLLREDERTVYTRAELVEKIKNNEAEVYAKDMAGHSAPIRVFRNEWLKTEANDDECDNLDNLPTFVYSC